VTESQYALVGRVIVWTLIAADLVGVFLLLLIVADWAWDRVVRHFGLYKELIAFMWDRRKAKRRSGSGPLPENEEPSDEELARVYWSGDDDGPDGETASARRRFVFNAGREFERSRANPSPPTDSLGLTGEVMAHPELSDARVTEILATLRRFANATLDSLKICGPGDTERDVLACEWPEGVRALRDAAEYSAYVPNSMRWSKMADELEAWGIQHDREPRQSSDSTRFRRGCGRGP
jgi:hypothetical protein